MGNHPTSMQCPKSYSYIWALRRCWIFSLFLPSSAAVGQRLRHFCLVCFFFAVVLYSPQYIVVFRAAGAFTIYLGLLFGVSVGIVACSACSILLLARASGCRHMGGWCYPPILKQGQHHSCIYRQHPRKHLQGLFKQDFQRFDHGGAFLCCFFLWLLVVLFLLPQSCLFV